MGKSKTASARMSKWRDNKEWAAKEYVKVRVQSTPEEIL